MASAACNILRVKNIMRLPSMCSYVKQIRECMGQMRLCKLRESRQRQKQTGFISSSKFTLIENMCLTSGLYENHQSITNCYWQRVRRFAHQSQCNPSRSEYAECIQKAYSQQCPKIYPYTRDIFESFIKIRIEFRDVCDAQRHRSTRRAKIKSKRLTTKKRALSRPHYSMHMICVFFYAIASLKFFVIL